ncbi:hypothetical protein EI94DRAFT_887994 [Lactarius quietus]|nr:hypothetical protein EI94DRAFT_887994 [Lactarius quietus]
MSPTGNTPANLISFDSPNPMQGNININPEQTAEEENPLQGKRRTQETTAATTAMNAQTTGSEQNRRVAPQTNNTLQSYTMPPPNSRESPQLPESPTPDPHKRRRTEKTPGPRKGPNDFERRMSVDENTANTPNTQETARWAAPGNQPNANTGFGESQDTDGTEQTHPAGNTRVEIDESEAEKIIAAITAANKNVQAEIKLNALPPPPDKFTAAEMPQIYSNSPAALLEGVDRDQALRWVQIPTGKVLARPFDADVHYQPNHQYIAIDLIAAVDEIAGTKVASVAPPFKDKNSGVTGRHPTTFLVHNLTPYEVNTLLSRTVWSSKEITFQVSPVTTRRPKFLFTLVGFTTLNTNDVHKAVRETWKDPTTVTFFDGLVLQAPEPEKNNVTKGILDFINSTEIRFLDIRREGNRREPHYNVYADGQLLPNDNLWYEIKSFLKGRTYKSADCGRGRIPENFTCGLCHGCDHPRGLCPFPKIPGWNGGGNRAEPRVVQEFARGGARGTGRTLKRSFREFQSGNQPGQSGSRRN